MCGEKIMIKPHICDVCEKDKRQLLIKLVKGKIIKICKDCNKKEEL